MMKMLKHSVNFVLKDIENWYNSIIISNFAVLQLSYNYIYFYIKYRIYFPFYLVIPKYPFIFVSTKLYINKIKERNNEENRIHPQEYQEHIL